MLPTGVYTEGPIPRKQKELSDRMPSLSPIPTNASTTNPCVLGTVPLMQPLATAPKRSSGPYAFGIVGLAIAVLLWGYGCKLSLYHATRSSVPIAKLWIEPRGVSVVLASQLGRVLHLLSGEQTAFVTLDRLPGLCRTSACIRPVCQRLTLLFGFLVPSRAPPLSLSLRIITISRSN